MEAVPHLGYVHSFREIGYSLPYPINSKNLRIIVASKNAIKKSNFLVIYVVVCADWKKALWVLKTVFGDFQKCTDLLLLTCLIVQY